MTDPTRLDRAHGCLLGQLAGDSLGSLVEFLPPEVIRERHPAGVRDLADGGTWGTLAGQPTDDSEMALMLARCLIGRSSYDPGAALDAYVHWYTSAPFDVGGTIGQALQAAAAATSTADRLTQVARHANPERASNGSLMRISPLGIFGAGRPDAAEWARADSRLTHPHPFCQSACAAYVAALATAIDRGGGPEVAYAAALAEADRHAAPPEVREALTAARERPPRDYMTQMGSVLVALQNAFYQLLHAPSLEEGVVDTVMRGGDTDTTGAIAGALLGAVHGRMAVPVRWAVAVLSCRPQSGHARRPRPAEFWPVDALELAESLLTRSDQEA
jgi:ADP-ribosyl-[dinitrogen reductase] hydrolase